MEMGTEQKTLDAAWMERFLAAATAAAATGTNTIFPTTPDLVMRHLQALYAQQAFALQPQQSYRQSQIIMPQAAQMLKNAMGVAYSAPFLTPCPEAPKWPAFDKPNLTTGLWPFGKQDDLSTISAPNVMSPPEGVGRKRIKTGNTEKDDSQKSEVFINNDSGRFASSSIRKPNTESFSVDEEEGSPSSVTHCSPKKEGTSLSRSGNSDAPSYHSRKRKSRTKITAQEENSGIRSQPSSPTAAATTRKYRGVNRKQSGSWEARINCRRKWLYLGYFKTAEQAARAFDRAAISIRGVSSAVLNFPIAEYEEEEIKNLQDMGPEQLVNYLKQESYRTNTATKFHRKKNCTDSIDENDDTENACSGEITGQEMRSPECDERDTPSEDVSHWTASASEERKGFRINKAEHAQSLGKDAVHSAVQIAELMMSMKSRSSS